MEIVCIVSDYWQVLSSSVAHALEYLGDEDTVETIKFVKIFDHFFDCFNVRCLQEGIQKRKPDLQPYTDPCDSRLKGSAVSVQLSLCA